MRPAYRPYALVALTAAYMINLLDRGLMALLMQPIKEDLHLSDTQLGFLTGIAFALFYATLGVPIARWADRGNRVTIASCAIGLWSVTVMACLFVTSYVQLVAARVAAAVGESGTKPPTYSLVGDYFPEPAERTRAMSIYWLGGPIAALISFIVGGWLNEMYGWRMTFFLMGIPGLLLAVVIRFVLIEPRAKNTAGEAQSTSLPSMGVVLGTLWKQKSCRHLTIALILAFTMLFGLSPWSAAFMIRSHGMDTRELGVWLGLIYGLSGTVGILFGGFVANRWFTGDERGQMRMSALIIAAATPLFIAFLLAPDRTAALVLFAVWYAALGCFVAPIYAMLQRLVPDEMRATSMAAIMLLYNLIGMGLGPQAVGLLSDLFVPALAAESLRYAMLVISVVALWSAYHFWRAGLTVNADLAASAVARSAGRSREESGVRSGGAAPSAPDRVRSVER